jgi:serine protease Do
VVQTLTQLTAVCLAMLFAGEGIARAQSTRDTIAAVRPKMVKIFGAGGLQRLYSYSTGFLVSPHGHIVTVWSHVLDADSVTVVLDDGRKFQGKVLGAEPQLDLAVLKIEGEELPCFDLESEIQPAIDPGTRVLAFSNMFKVATGDEPVSVLHGVISAQTKLSGRRGAHEIPYTGPVYIVDAITNNPGSGGGLLTTRNGKLLAMIGKEIRNTQSNTWINYAIPLGELKTPIAEIISGRFTTKPTGPDIDSAGPPRRYVPLDFGLVMVPDVLYRTPAFLDSVVPGSAAAKAGLKSDDLVLFVNNELVQSCKTMADALGKLESGDTLRLVVRRDGKLVTVELPVEKKGEE